MYRINIHSTYTLPHYLQTTHAYLKLVKRKKMGGNKRYYPITPKPPKGPTAFNLYAKQASSLVGQASSQIIKKS